MQREIGRGNLKNGICSVDLIAVAVDGYAAVDLECFVDVNIGCKFNRCDIRISNAAFNSAAVLIPEMVEIP